MSNRLDPLIQAKLRAFARRRRRLIIVRGIFAAIAVLFFTMILVAAVDFASTAYFNVFLPKWVRTALSVVAYASVIVVMWRQCLTQLLHAPDERQLARLIEHAEPLLREDLISAVELGTSPGGVFDSQQFRGLLQEDVANRMQSMQMKSLLPVALIRRYIGVAVVILACIAAGVILTHGQLHTLLLRALLPNANLANVSRTKVQVIEPLGGDKIVPQGSTQRVEIEITGQRTNKATLESETEQGGSQVIAMQPLGGDKFAATIQVQRENVKYRIKAGDHLSRDYQFEAKERPFITKFEKTYHFPKYAKRAAQVVTETDGSLRALEGTEVDLLLLPNQAVQGAELRIEQGKMSTVVALTTTPDGRLAARLPLMASGTYRVHLVSKETGFINEFSPENELRAEPDLVPSVELTQPKSDLILPNNELVDLAGQASDDLGLAKLAQLVKVNDGPWRETVIAKEDLGPKAAISHRWDLYDLNGKPGDLITTKLVATDLKGNKGESRPLQVTITAAGFELRRLQALDALRALNDTTHALADQTELLAKTGQRFREQIHSTDNADVRRQAVVALDGALTEFEAKFTEASARLWNALREAPPGHMSAELVLLGRELSRLGIQAKRVVKTNVDLLAANAGLGGAKEMANDTQEAGNQIQARARIAEQAMEAFTTAEEAAVLSENGQVVAREQTRLMELAAASGNDVAKWQPLMSRLRVALTQTKAIEDLVTPITTRQGSQLRDRSKQTIAALSKRRLKLEQAMTGSEPSAKLLLEPTAEMTRTLKEYARIFAEWHRDLGNRPVEMVQAVHRSVGPSYENISKLPAELDSVRKSKILAEEARGPLLENRWAARGEALKGHGDLEELRTTADNQFVGDLRVATSALEALHVLAGGMEEGQMEERLTALDRSLRVLETGHNLLELFDGLNFVATNERWDIRSLAARTQSPRDWKWLEARLRTVPDEMGRTMEAFQRDGQGKLGLKFLAYDVDPKNPQKITVQINAGEKRTYFLEVGGAIPGTNFKVANFEKKEAPGNGGVTADVSEITLVDKVSGATKQLKVGATVEVERPDPGVKKALEEARQILWKSQQLPAWRTLNEEMGNRVNIERLPSSVKTDAELLAGQVKLALDLLRPHLDAARLELAKLSPKISELAQALAKEQNDLKKETAEQAQKAEKQTPEEAKKEAQQQLTEQQKLDEKLETLKDLIRAEANQKNILDREQREQMRDADDALALLKDPPPKAEQALQDAVNDAQAQQKADLERATEQQQKLQEALTQVAKHYDAKEQGKSVAETRAALREAEKQLGVKEELDQQFAHAQMLAEMAQKNATDLLKELEAKLPNNPVMQKELSDISKDALASAEQKLNQASQQEKAVADQLAQQANQQQAAQQQTEKKAQEQVAQTAADAAKQAMEAAKSAKAAADNAEKQAERIGNKMVDDQADTAGDKAEQAAQAAQEAMKAAEQMAKAGDAAQAAQAAEKAMQKSAEAAQAAKESAQAAKEAQATAQQAAQQPGEHQAENQQSAQQAGEAAQHAEKAAQAAQKAKDLAQQAAKQAKAMAQNANQPAAQNQPGAAKTAAQNAAQAAEKAAQAAKNAQEAAESAEKQATAAGNQPAAQQADMAGNDAAKAAEAAQAAAEAAGKAAESGNAQQAAQAAQQAAQKAGEAAQAAEKAAGAAQQAQTASNQAAQQGGDKQGSNQDAAQKAGEAQQQAQAAAQAAKQAQAMAQDAAQQAATAAQQAPQLAQAANQQQAIAQNAVDAAAELERAGRHEMRLGNQTGEQLQKLGAQVADTAKTDVPAAQQALQQAQMANQAQAAVNQAAGELSQQLASLQNAQQGGPQPPSAPTPNSPPPGNPPAAPSAAAPAANTQPGNAETAANAAPAPAGQQAPAPAAPAEAGAAASPAEQAAMARALDALDQQLNAPPASAQAAQAPSAPGQSAQATPPGGQESQAAQQPPQAGQPTAGQPGGKSAPPSAAQAAMAQAAQAAATAMRQNRAQQGMGQTPGAMVSQSQSEKSEGGAQAQGDAGGYKLDTTVQGLKRGEWGKLPKKLADQLTKGQQEAVAGDYRQAVETYYKVIAERAKKQ